MTRLGAKLPFGQAVEEVFFSHKVRITEEGIRQETEKNGAVEVARIEAEVAALELGQVTPTAHPQQVVVSADGVMVHLTNGEWYEVKSIAVGEFDSIWNARKSEMQVKTNKLSYFASSYRVRDFERYSWAELHQRGVTNAPKIVVVNDGATWIQSFADYHVPQATRIIDFTHVTGYLAAAGKGIWGEGTPAFHQWYTAARHELKHKPPRETVGRLSLLLPKATTDEQRTKVDVAISYIESRLPMLDYPHFQRQALPIGSGTVESGHKVVVQPRLKGAGMRWAEKNLNPMLSLRNLIANDRWADGWSKLVAFRCQQQRDKRFAKAERSTTQPTPTTPLRLADLAPDPISQELIPAQFPQSSSRKPAPDHPWRRGVWPEKESLRYS